MPDDYSGQYDIGTWDEVASILGEGVPESNAKVGNYERLSRTTVFAVSKGLAADGSTDDTANLKSIIENNEGQTIVLEEDTGAIKLGSQLSPSTSGGRTVIDCRGNPTIDVSGVSTSPAISFANAPNVTLLGPVTIKGATGTSGVEGVRTGDGFRFRDLEFNAGGGALRVTATDVWGRGVTATNQDNGGSASCLHITNAKDVTIYDVEGQDSNRGIETEDNDSSSAPVSNVTVEGIRLDNISDAVLDVHTHTNGSKVENVTYRDFEITNCSEHIHVHDAGPGAEDITFETGEVVDSGEANYINGQNVLLRDIAFDYPSTDVTDVLQINGGRVTCESIRINDGSTNAVRIIGGTVVKLRDFRIDGSHTHFVKADSNAGLNSLIIEGTEFLTGPTTRALLIAGGAVSGGTYRFPLVIRDNNFYNKEVDIRSGNAVGIWIENTSFGNNAINSPAVLDGRLAGSYTGDGTQNRQMELGFKPNKVLVEGSDGSLYEVRNDGLSVIDGTAPSGELTIYGGDWNGGFEVGDNTTDADPNTNTETYSYVAFP